MKKLLFLAFLAVVQLSFSQTATTIYGSHAGADLEASSTHNSFYGYSAGGQTTTGSYNVFIGQGAGRSNITSDQNTYIGSGAGFSSTGEKNVFVGRTSGYNNTGSNNVFLGFNAGRNETGSNMLYIANSNTSDPLIYGEFNNSLLRINGALHIKSASANDEVGITQNHVGGASTMEFTTMDGNGTQATRLLLRGNNEFADVEFYNGNRGAESLTMKIEGENGKVAIGTTSYGNGNYKLYVADGIRTEAVQIDAETLWPDYVFTDDYRLSPLSEVEAFISKNKHLPDVPSAKEVEENGINVAEMDATLLRKIEELTLHTIQQQKEIAALKAALNTLIQQNENK